MRMSTFLELASLACVTLIQINCTACITLNTMQHKYVCLERTAHKNRGECNSLFVDDLVKHLVGKNATNDDMSEITTRPFLTNPCLLAKIASYFEVHTLRVIVSSQYFDLLNNLKSCKDVSSRIVGRKSVVPIQGDEYNFNDLKSNALNFLERDIKCYIVLCSEVCSSLILYIAATLGFGVEIYFWMTTNYLIHVHKVKHPKKLTAVTVLKEHDGSKKIVLTTQYGITSIKSIDVQYSRERKEIPSRQLVAELKSTRGSNNYSILYSHYIATLVEKATLKVVTLFGNSVKHRPDFLDHTEMKCQHGVLCWYFPMKIRTFADKREASCCFGFLVSLLKQLKEDLDINFYIYEGRDGRYGAEKNGSWNGLIGEVASGKADIAAHADSF